jgi:hypothetical protein
MWIDGPTSQQSQRQQWAELLRKTMLRQQVPRESCASVPKPNRRLSRETGSTLHAALLLISSPTNVTLEYAGGTRCKSSILI